MVTATPAGFAEPFINSHPPFGPGRTVLVGVHAGISIGHDSKPRPLPGRKSANVRKELARALPET